MQRPKFVAGVVCPQCRALDRIVVEQVDGERRQRCVACGFIKADVGSAAEQKPTPNVNPNPQQGQDQVAGPGPGPGPGQSSSWIPASGPGQLKGRLERSLSATEVKPIKIIDPAKKKR